jgi:hypothetical protein
VIMKTRGKKVGRTPHLSPNNEKRVTSVRAMSRAESAAI